MQGTWRFVSRVDGQPWLHSPVRLFDGSTTADVRALYDRAGSPATTTAEVEDKTKALSALGKADALRAAEAIGLRKCGFPDTFFADDLDPVADRHSHISNIDFGLVVLGGLGLVRLECPLESRGRCAPSEHPGGQMVEADLRGIGGDTDPTRQRQRSVGYL